MLFYSEQLQGEQGTTNNNIRRSGELIEGFIPIFKETAIQVRDTEYTGNSHSDFSSDDSLVDKDYVPSSEDDHSDKSEGEHNNTQEDGSPARKRTDEGGISARKKRSINVRKEQKQMRDHGKEARNRKGKVIPEKQFRPAGTCCRKRCFEKINVEQQRAFYDNFYECSKVEQNQILAGGVTISNKNSDRKGRGKTGITHNRQVTARYSLKLNGSIETVCKNMFQSVYGLTKFKVDYLVQKLKHAPAPVTSLEDRRGRHEPKNKKIEERKAMLEHIEKYPKYESHYTRRDTEKKYLQSHLNITMLYNEYKAEHPNAASYDLFREVFKSTGYSFKQPQVDTCKTCDSFVLKIKQSTDPTEKNQLTLEHNQHKDMADLAYKLKDADKKQAKEDPSIRVLVFDLQQVLDTPSLTTNVSFYKRLLSTFNLTIRDCTTDGGTTSCYMWHEAIGKRGSDEIASCVLKKLESLPETVTQVITYSDTCGGQNRNINMAIMFSYFVSQSSHVNCVDQKFLLSGHTHLECDVDHARIERSKKTAEIPIMVPRDWFQFVRTVRGKKPFQVHEITQQHIFSFSKLVQDYVTRRTIDTEGMKVNWLEIKWIRYEKTFGLLQFKTSLSDENFRVLDLRRLKRGKPPRPLLTKCYDGPLPINPLKKKDLLSLLPLIHSECHNFYLNLETSARVSELPEDHSEGNE